MNTFCLDFSMLEKMRLEKFLIYYFESWTGSLLRKNIYLLVNSGTVYWHCEQFLMQAIILSEIERHDTQKSNSQNNHLRYLPQFHLYLACPK